MGKNTTDNCFKEFWKSKKCSVAAGRSGMKGGFVLFDRNDYVESREISRVMFTIGKKGWNYLHKYNNCP